MNLGTLKTHITNRTGNDAIGTVLNEFIHQIQFDFCSRYPWKFMESPYTTLTMIPNQAYLCPSAYLTNFGQPLDAMELQTPQKLIYIPNWDLAIADPDYFKSTTTGGGVPTHYSIEIDEITQSNSRLWLYPIPDSSYQMKIRYMKLPRELSATTAELLVPSKYHYIIAAGVESMVWQLDEDLQSSNAANQRYEAGIIRSIENEQQSPDYQPIFKSQERFVDYSDPFLEC